MAANASRLAQDDESPLERSFTSSTRSTNGPTRLRNARSVTSLNSTAGPHVDSTICDTVTLEQRDKFTVSCDDRSV